MLLGHWLAIRSVRQASGALSELARLLPDSADRISPEGQVESAPLSELPLAAGVLASLGVLLSPVAGALLRSISAIVVALNAQLLRLILL